MDFIKMKDCACSLIWKRQQKQEWQLKQVLLPWKQTETLSSRFHTSHLLHKLPAIRLPSHKELLQLLVGRPAIISAIA